MPATLDKRAELMQTAAKKLLEQGQIIPAIERQFSGSVEIAVPGANDATPADLADNTYRAKLLSGFLSMDIKAEDSIVNAIFTINPEKDSVRLSFRLPQIQRMAGVTAAKSPAGGGGRGAY